MFEIGSIVSYSSTGVCRVDGEIKQRVKGELKSYVVLKPVHKNNSTVYIPVDNEALISKVKPVMSPEEAEEVIRDMSEFDGPWIVSTANVYLCFVIFFRQGI